MNYVEKNSFYHNKILYLFFILNLALLSDTDQIGQNNLITELLHALICLLPAVGINSTPQDPTHKY